MFFENADTTRLNSELKTRMKCYRTVVNESPKEKDCRRSTLSQGKELETFTFGSFSLFTALAPFISKKRLRRYYLCSIY